MAIIFAVVGGGAIVGISTYENYSDWDAYSDWGEYSDAAERKRKRIEAQKQEAKSSAQNLLKYKEDTVNPELTDEQLKEESAMTVSAGAMDTDVKMRLDATVLVESEEQAKEETRKIKEIDRLLKRIREIEEEENSHES